MSNGKGSRSRPYAVSAADYRTKHDATFGRRIVPVCPVCGSHTVVTVLRPRHPARFQCVPQGHEWSPSRGVR